MTTYPAAIDGGDSLDGPQTCLSPDLPDTHRDAAAQAARDHAAVILDLITTTETPGAG